jgi:hypothetical protein
MSINRGINAKVKPMSTRVHQGAPHAGALDLGLAIATESLWYKTCGTVHSFHWPDPITAPTVTITAIDTDYYFSVNNATEDVTIKLPWAAQLNAKRLDMRVEFAYATSHRGHVWAEAVTMVTAITTVAGAQQTMTLSDFGKLDALWGRGDIGWRESPVFLSVEPDYASSRVIALQIGARLGIASSAYPVLTSFEHVIKIRAISAWDVMEPASV